MIQGRLSLIAIVMLSSLALIQKSGAQTKVSEPTAGFSYTAPAGWQVRTFPGLKFKIAIAAPKNGFSLNINVVDEKYAGSLKEYVKGALRTMAAMFAEYKLIGQSDFATSSGLKGVRLVSQSRQQKILARATVYIFPGKGTTKLIVTCSSLAEDGASHDAVFESVMKTFAVK